MHLKSQSIMIKAKTGNIEISLIINEVSDNFLSSLRFDFIDKSDVSINGISILKRS